jgi:hypothetical protein
VSDEPPTSAVGGLPAPSFIEVGPPREPDVQAPREPRFVEGKHDRVRKWLAYALVGIFAFEVIASFLLLWQGTKVEDIKEILLEVISPTVALAGSALGFYFGTKV